MLPEFSLQLGLENGVTALPAAVINNAYTVMLEPHRYYYLLHDCLVRIPNADNHNSFIKLRLLKVIIAITFYLRFNIKGELKTSLVLLSHPLTFYCIAPIF